MLQILCSTVELDEYGETLSVGDRTEQLATRTRGDCFGTRLGATASIGAGVARAPDPPAPMTDLPVHPTTLDGAADQPLKKEYVMIQFAVVAAVGVEENALSVPPIVFAAVAFAVFVFMAFVVWSFRDVSNRHGNKTGGQAGHSGTSTTEHD